MDKKPRSLLAVLLAMPLLSSTGGHCADVDEGWERAVQAMAPFDQLVPTESMLRENGRIEGTGEACRNDAVLRLRCLSDEGPVWDVVETTGMASTTPNPEVRCVSALDRAPRRAEFHFATTGATPLSAGEQKRVRSKATGETRSIDGRACRVHEFEWRRTVPVRERILGTACLDAESGLPLVVESVLRRPPKGLRRLSYATYYGPVLENAWAMTRVEVDFFLEDDEGEEPSARVNVDLSGHARMADLAEAGACDK